MKFTKKKIIILSTTFVIAIAIIFFLFFKKSLNKYEYTPEQKDKIKEEIKQSTDSIVSKDVTVDSIRETLQDENIINIFLTVGEQSYLRNKPIDKLIKKYNLSSLVEEQKSYVEKVEKKYLDNLQYNIVSESENGNELCENIEIITYYYSLYLTDYINIITALLEIPINEVDEEEESQIEYYKLQLKALKVLDKHLDEYDNFSKEKEKVQICYENGKLKDKTQMLTLAVALQGELYSNMDMSDENVVKKTDERLEKYLKEIEEMQ